MVSYLNQLLPLAISCLTVVHRFILLFPCLFLVLVYGLLKWWHLLALTGASLALSLHRRVRNQSNELNICPLRDERRFPFYEVFFSVFFIFYFFFYSCDEFLSRSSPRCCLQRLGRSPLAHFIFLRYSSRVLAALVIGLILSWIFFVCIRVSYWLLAHRSPNAHRHTLTVAGTSRTFEERTDSHSLGFDSNFILLSFSLDWFILSLLNVDDKMCV